MACCFRNGCWLGQKLFMLTIVPLKILARFSITILITPFYLLGNCKKIVFIDQALGLRGLLFVS